MRKKLLIKEIENVINRNNELFEKCSILEQRLNEKNNELDKLNLILEEQRAENDILRHTIETRLAEKQCNNAVIPEIGEKPEFTEKMQSETCVAEENTELKDEITEAIQEPADVKVDFEQLINESVLKLSSSAIGRVVLRCAEVCNTFSNNNYQNSKDLVNLALGRTEVFKSEVLQLISDDSSEDILLAELNLKETEVKEYFELLLRQQ